MIWVVIDGGVIFAPNQGVLIDRVARDWGPERLYDAVQLALLHIDDEYLVDACCGGCGPLAGYGEVTYERYLELVREAYVAEAGRKAKKQHTNIRRRQFDGNRSRLVLLMLEAGVRYECAKDGCTICEDLTVDHIIPLSRGGTDDLKNLRFLCGPHNSQKGDRCSV